MKSSISSRLRCGVLFCAVVCSAALVGCATPPDGPPWPEQVVSVDKLKLLTPLRAQFYSKRTTEPKPYTVVMRLAVDTEGRVTRRKIEQSSGHAELDEAAMSATLPLRFAPNQFGGVPQVVTVMMPMHFKF